jgi:Photosystem I reaction centre subunit IX / PsaJ
MSSFAKYLTSAPIVSLLTLVAISVFLIALNYYYPGLQYGTYFKPLP